MARIRLERMFDMEKSFLATQGKYKGIRSWIFSTDHKRISFLYLTSMLTFFLVAAALGVIMKLKMLTPGNHFLSPRTYNSLFTVHGVMMIFLFVIPGIPAALGNFILPLQLGAKDVAFPRQVAMYLCKELINDSLIKLGAAFGGKTHSTLLHAWKKISNQAETDTTLKQQLQMARRNLESND